MVLLLPGDELFDIEVHVLPVGLVVWNELFIIRFAKNIEYHEHTETNRTPTS